MRRQSYLHITLPSYTDTDGPEEWFGRGCEKPVVVFVFFFLYVFPVIDCQSSTTHWCFFYEMRTNVPLSLQRHSKQKGPHLMGPSPTHEMHDENWAMTIVSQKSSPITWATFCTKQWSHFWLTGQNPCCGGSPCDECKVAERGF